MARTLDDFMPGVTTQDTRKRAQTYAELVPYLQQSDSSLYCEEMDKFVEGLANWVSGSNFKVIFNLLHCNQDPWILDSAHGMPCLLNEFITWMFSSAADSVPPWLFQWLQVRFLI